MPPPVPTSRRLIHPEVRRRIAEWQAGLVQDGYRGPLVADIPLLFETGRTGDFDAIVVVACDPARQRTRLIERDRLSEDEADQRIVAQWPIADKVRAADYVVMTDGTFADTDAQVDALVATAALSANSAFKVQNEARSETTPTLKTALRANRFRVREGKLDRPATLPRLPSFELRPS